MPGATSSSSAQHALHLAGGGEFATHFCARVRGLTLVLTDVANQCHDNHLDGEGPVDWHRSVPGFTSKDELNHVGALPRIRELQLE